eukprot:gene548-1205_t
MIRDPKHTQFPLVKHVFKFGIPSLSVFNVAGIRKRGTMGKTKEKLTGRTFLHVLKNFLCFVFAEEVSCDTPDVETLPGHLKPLGEGRPISKVQEVDGFPEPNKFFEDYVNPKKPVIFKGGAKLSPAYQLWSDEYLKNHPKSEEMQFDIEIGKKENRQGNMQKRSVKDFINSYHTDDVYGVTDVPDILKHQFLLPPSIRCQNIKNQLSMMLMWFSSGGTKSVLHQDSFENINCLFRGSKRLIMIEYPKYVKDVVIDRPNGYSAVDVDKVDYTKYPGLSKVDFVEANMEQGDCLYIPYQWFHQVNSFPNENQTNTAVNVWWIYNTSFVPKDCNMKAEEATLDKFKFQDVDQPYGGEDGEEEAAANPEDIFASYFKEKNAPEITFDEFAKDISSPDSNLAEIGLVDIRNRKRRQIFAKQFFDILDLDGNGIVDYNDYNSEDPDKREDSSKKLSDLFAEIDKYFESLGNNDDSSNEQQADSDNAKDEL